VEVFDGNGGTGRLRGLDISVLFEETTIVLDGEGVAAERLKESEVLKFRNRDKTIFELGRVDFAPLEEPRPPLPDRLSMVPWTQRSQQ
jgi:hypothetical protein